MKSNQDVFIKLVCGCGPAAGRPRISHFQCCDWTQSSFSFTCVLGRWNSAVWSTNQNSRQLVPVIFTLPAVIVTMIPINIFHRELFNCKRNERWYFCISFYIQWPRLMRVTQSYALRPSLGKPVILNTSPVNSLPKGFWKTTNLVIPFVYFCSSPLKIK